MRTDKIWANSGDSHAMEPDDLWERELPASLAERGPRVSRDERMETVHVDDQVAFRTLASFADAGSSAPGAHATRSCASPTSTRRACGAS